MHMILFLHEEYGLKSTCVLIACTRSLVTQFLSLGDGDGPFRPAALAHSVDPCVGSGGKLTPTASAPPK